MMCTFLLFLINYSSSQQLKLLYVSQRLIAVPLFVIFFFFLHCEEIVQVALSLFPHYSIILVVF